MNYHGFSTRDHLLFENTPIQDSMSILEIGVGSGSSIDLFIGKVNQYWGIDISLPLINLLKVKYNLNSSVHLFCLDVCDTSKSLDKHFDIVISADTLEHVKNPKKYFNFVARHLKQEGLAVITFPNESAERHHGITWFNTKRELLATVQYSGLRIEQIFTVKKTLVHEIIRLFLWKYPKLIINIIFGSDYNNQPQSYEDTQSFSINIDGGFKARIFSTYAKLITKTAAFFTLYKVSPLTEEIINNQVILIKLSKKSC